MARKSKKTENTNIIPRFDLQLYKSLPYEQKLKQTIKLAHTANQRLRTLEKKGLAATSSAYKIVQNYRDTTGKVRFSEKKKYESENLLDIQLAGIVEFLNKPTSYVVEARAAKESQEKRIATFLARYGIDLTKGNEDMFFDFLKSMSFKKRSALYDSGQIVDDISEELDQGYSIEDIVKSFKQYEDNINTDTETTDKQKKKAKKNGRLMNAKSTRANKKRRKK